jgi:hypothetical protein
VQKNGCFTSQPEETAIVAAIKGLNVCGCGVYIEQGIVTKESAEEWMLYLTVRRDSNNGSNRRT